MGRGKVLISAEYDDANDFLHGTTLERVRLDLAAGIYLVCIPSVRYMLGRSILVLQLLQLKKVMMIYRLLIINNNRLN